MSDVLKIGTRKSPLALWQAEWVRGQLEALGHRCELVPLSTQGDRVLDRALSEVGGKGLFVKELEEALQDGRADLAVHSAKDVPYQLDEQFSLCAFPSRDDVRDALVAPRARTFAQLPMRAKVGTSSLRRACQLLAARPDLEIVAVRGNVATRLSRATGIRPDGAEVPAEQRLDAVVLAYAGLRRLGLAEQATELLSIELSLPAAGQGALAIETRRGSRGEEICARLDLPLVRLCVRAERAVLSALGGSCTVPIGAHAVVQPSASGAPEVHLRAILGGPDGRGGIRLLRAQASGPVQADEAELLGARAAQSLREAGAEELLQATSAFASGLPAPKRSGP